MMIIISLFYSILLKILMLSMYKACNRREKESLPLTHPPPTHVDGSDSTDGLTARTGSEAYRDMRACLRDRTRNLTMTGYHSAKR